jgi:uncharacterized membrane protein
MRVISALPTVLAAATAIAFLVLTPSGLLAKLNMVGYSVCHQIESHSYVIGGRQLPLCARCTGTFGGALIGLLGQVFVLRRSRSAAFPPAQVIGLLVLFIVLLGVDGANSYLTFFPGLPHLYEPCNWLRLTTGGLYGIALSAIVYPVVGLTLWRCPCPRPAVSGLRDLGILLVLAMGFVGLVATRWSVLLYPLALASAFGVVALLTCVNTVLVTMLAHRENSMHGWRDALPALLTGFALSMVEIGLIGIVRFMLTGTLDGIPLIG